MCKEKTKAKPENVKKMRQEKQEITDSEEESSDSDLSRVVGPNREGEDQTQETFGSGPHHVEGSQWVEKELDIR